MMRTVIALTICLAAFSAQAERQYEYKCWVTLANGSEVISFQKLDTKRQHSKAKNLLLKEKKVYTNKGVRALKQVHECVELQQSFIHMKARELDKITIR